MFFEVPTLIQFVLSRERGKNVTACLQCYIVEVGERATIFHKDFCSWNKIKIRQLFVFYKQKIDEHNRLMCENKEKKYRYVINTELNQNYVPEIV